MPHDAAVMPNRLAIAGSETCKSAAISGKKGARVLPVAVAAKSPMHPAITSLHGIVAVPVTLYVLMRRVAFSADYLTWQHRRPTR
jgi:hypothetical protein